MPRAKKPAAKVAPPPKEGSVINYILQSGAAIDAVADAEGKPCCPTCERRLPKQKRLSPQEQAKAEARLQKLQSRLFEEQAQILKMMNKTREKLGQAPITLDEALAEEG